jgi:hypothetical protein
MPVQKSCVNVNSILFASRGGRVHIALAYRKCVCHIGQIIRSSQYVVPICVWDIHGRSLYAESILVTSFPSLVVP